MWWFLIYFVLGSVRATDLKFEGIQMNHPADDKQTVTFIPALTLDSESDPRSFIMYPPNSTRTSCSVLEMWILPAVQITKKFALGKRYINFY